MGHLNNFWGDDELTLGADGVAVARAVDGVVGVILGGHADLEKVPKVYCSNLSGLDTLEVKDLRNYNSVLASG